VLAGHQSDERSDGVAGEPVPVADLDCERERGQRRHPAQTAQSSHDGRELAVGGHGPDRGIESVTSGVDGENGVVVGLEGQSCRGRIEPLVADPTQPRVVGTGPGPALGVDETLTQEQFRQPVPGPHQITTAVLTGPDQVTGGLLLEAGHDHRRDLVHGLWMTPRSWDRWTEYYRAKGYQVIVPAYPGFEIEVEALREKPEVIAEASVPETLEHLIDVVEGLDAPPIIMGHSFGGTFTQLLVNRGLGAAAVTIDSAPPEGVRVNPPSQIKSLFPVLANPANRHRAVGFTKEQFHYAFANTCSRAESDEAYDRLHIPAPGSWMWAYGLIANWKPGHQETWVDYDLDDRAPLLFIIGGKDHLMPPSVQRANAKKYRNSEALTETYEFPDRSHFTGVEPGWEQVADYALEWARSHAGARQG
jgi:pimeloyl-ACP methyl ester carboxylesterase